MTFKYFSRNQQGRDFVVGDIHGHFSSLERLLLQLQFDTRRDRLFSVGDLIDRGPESWRVIEFINYPWFHAVRGNHEQMLLDAEHVDLVHENWVTHNGGDWWRHVPPRLQPRMRKVIRALPLAMEINTAWGQVGLVHADIPPSLSWQRFVSLLNTDAEVREQALWSRHRFRNLKMMGRIQPIEGIDLVVFGHTPVSRPIQQGNVCYIDTGAVYTQERELGHLTLMEISPKVGFYRWCTRTNRLEQDSVQRQERARVTAPA